MTPGDVLTTLHRFGSFTDGSVPLGGLIQGVDGRRHGTATSGGANCIMNGNGTLFSMQLD